MIVDDNDAELLKRSESEQQKSIDSYSNYDLKKPQLVSTEPAASGHASVGAKQLRQNEEDGLCICSGEVTEDDHGKKFISDDDEFFEPPAQKKMKCTTMMETEREILQADYYEDYDEATLAMETYDEEFKESSFEDEEVQYTHEFTDYMIDVSTIY